MPGACAGYAAVSFAIFSLSLFFHLSICLTLFLPSQVPAPFFPSALRLSVCPLANVVSWQWFVDLMGRKGAPTLYKVVGTARNRWRRWLLQRWLPLQPRPSFVYSILGAACLFLSLPVLSSRLRSSLRVSFLPSIHQTRWRNKIDNAVQSRARLLIYKSKSTMCSLLPALFFFLPLPILFRLKVQIQKDIEEQKTPCRSDFIDL